MEMFLQTLQKGPYYYQHFSAGFSLKEAGQRDQGAHT